MHCNMRYDDLFRERVRIESRKDIDAFEAETGPDGVHPEVEAYFKRYWGLKSDQLDYWFAGYIDPETLISWFLSTADAFGGGRSPPASVGGVTYAQGWALVRDKHEIINQRLIELVDEIDRFAERNGDRAEEYKTLFVRLSSIERQEVSLIRMLTSMFKHRPTFKDLLSTLGDEEFVAALRAALVADTPEIQGRLVRASGFGPARVESV